MPRIQSVSELPETDRQCACCGKKLKPTGKVQWLELNNKTGYYQELGTVKPEESQGIFPLGLGCARKKLQEWFNYMGSQDIQF